MTPEQKKLYDKLVTYADTFSIVGNALIVIDAIIRTKVPNKKARDAIDASLQAVYAGLANLDDTIHTAIDDLENGKDPDFSPDIPPSPSLPPFNPDSSPPNWFKLAWNTLSPALALVAHKWPKFAEYYAPFKAAGDKLVEVLTKYFPPGSKGATVTYAQLHSAIKDSDDSNPLEKVLTLLQEASNLVGKVETLLQEASSGFNKVKDGVDQVNNFIDDTKDLQGFMEIVRDAAYALDDVPGLDVVSGPVGTVMSEVLDSIDPVVEEMTVFQNGLLKDVMGVVNDGANITGKISTYANDFHMG